MGWGTISAWGIPRISNLAEAAKHWADQKPWRNEHTNWRQLEGRRATHKRIVKLSDDRGYEMVLHNTPVVTYYADGNLALQTYDSASTIAFAWKVRPAGFDVEPAQGAMYWGVPTEGGVKYVRPKHTTLHLVLVRPGVYQISSPVVEDFEWKLDPKKAAAVRKKLSHYDRWQKLTTRLTGANVFYKQVSKRELQYLLDDPTNPELFSGLNLDHPRMLCPPPVINFLRDAYLLEGARYQVPVPMGELPRIQR